eukprot:11189458-Lingulodinium_polyedra.AAC.1
MLARWARGILRGRRPRAPGPARVQVAPKLYKRHIGGIDRECKQIIVKLQTHALIVTLVRECFVRVKIAKACK